jgi:hypothetical protein
MKPFLLESTHTSCRKRGGLEAWEAREAREAWKGRKVQNVAPTLKSPSWNHDAVIAESTDSAENLSFPNS